MNDVLRAEDINPLLPHPMEVLLLIAVCVGVVVALVLVVLFLARRTSARRGADSAQPQPSERPL